MKLSDAILLGSTLLAGKPGRQYFSDGQAGCALGMAAIAKGCSFTNVYGVPREERRTLGAENVWGDWVLVVMERPCNCWRWRVPREMRIKDIIAHLFDYHVVAKKNWTLDQLVAWVKTVEPLPVLLRDVEPAPEDVSVSCLTVIPVKEPSNFRKQEIADWQQTREAFQARHGVRRRNRRPKPAA